MAAFIFKLINTLIFIGLIVTGSYLAFDYLVLFKVFNNSHGELGSTLLGVSIFFGWIFGALSILAFVAGSILLLSGYQKMFWRELYPLNFGLAMLGGAAFTYVPESHSSGLIIVVIIYSIGIAIGLSKVSFIYPRALWLGLTSVLLLGLGFWSDLVVAVLFISIFVFSGGFKENYFFWRHLIKT